MLSRLIARMPLLGPDDEQIATVASAPTTLWTRPTALHTWRRFVTAIVVDVAVHGNAFAAWSRVDRRGRPDRLVLLDPEAVSPADTWDPQRPDDDPWLAWIRVGDRLLAPSDYVHWRGMIRGGWAWGISPLKMLASAIAAQVSEQEYVRSTYDDGARVSGYLTTDQNVNPEVLGEAAQKFADAAGGRRAGIAALGGGLQWKSTALNHTDLQLLDSRQWSTTEAAMVLGVPPHLIGAATYDSDTYSSVQQDLRMFSALTLDGWRDIVMDPLAEHGWTARLGDRQLLAPTALEQAQADEIDVRSGIRTVDEVRADRGLEPLPAPAASPDSDEAPTPDVIDGGTP